MKNTKEIAEILNDIGITEDETEEIIGLCNSNKMENVLKALTKKRSGLLDNLHESQEKLYRMDFLIRKIKSERS